MGRPGLKGGWGGARDEEVRVRGHQRQLNPRLQRLHTQGSCSDKHALTVLIKMQPVSEIANTHSERRLSGEPSPLITFQVRSVRSAEQDTTRFSEIATTPVTLSRWPSNTCSTAPVVGSHERRLRKGCARE